MGRFAIAATPAVYNSSSSLLLRQLVLRTVYTPASPRYGPLIRRKGRPYMVTLDGLNAYIRAKNSSTDTLLAKADGYFYFTEGEGEILIDCLTRCTYKQWCEMIDQYIECDF